MKQTIFEEIKRINEYGQEFWSARELFKTLGYTEYGKFERALGRAQEACKQSGQVVQDHFAHVSEMIRIGTGTKKEAGRSVENYHLSRYACYLVAQNGDPRKKQVAQAQTYFAVQTRRQETDKFLAEDQTRILYREEITDKNKTLASIAKNAGVKDFGNFHDAGYMGLYGGLRQKDIKKLKKIPENKNLLDHMGSEELGANIFRVSQTNAKIRREMITGQEAATVAHQVVGKKVREAIKDLGGTMPEKLPAADHVKEAKKRLKKQTKGVKRLK